MATVGTAHIKFEIEPIVKVKCLAISCVHNGVNSFGPEDRGTYCNLKHIVIDKEGKCTSFVSIVDE